VQPLYKVKRGVGVCVSELQKLVVEVLHTLKRGRRTRLDDIGCLGRRGAHVLESFSRLRGPLFRHLIKCSRGVWFCGTSGSSCGPGHVHKALVLRAFTINKGRDALSTGPMSLTCQRRPDFGRADAWLGAVHRYKKTKRNELCRGNTKSDRGRLFSTLLPASAWIDEIVQRSRVARAS
jgi:hypothetical protein